MLLVILNPTNTLIFPKSSRRCPLYMWIQHISLQFLFLHTISLFYFKTMWENLELLIKTNFQGIQFKEIVKSEQSITYTKRDENTHLICFGGLG